MVDGAEISLAWLTLKEDSCGFLQRASKNVDASQREAGNLRYDLFHCGDDLPTRYVFFEVYKTALAAATHKEESHSKAWMPWLRDNVIENGVDRRNYLAHGVQGGIESFQGGDLRSDMELTIVHVSCKPGTEHAFLEACFKNQAGVRASEPDCARFDILQQKDNPTQFVLFEAFANAAAVAHHKTMQHYLSWREDVEYMMKDRRRPEKVFLAPLMEKMPVFDFKAQPLLAPHILRRRLISQLCTVGVGDKVEIVALCRILKCFDGEFFSEANVLLFLRDLRKTNGEVNIAEFIDFAFGDDCETTKEDVSSSLLKTRGLCNMLDDFSSLSYAYFQGTYYHAGVAEKLQPWLAGIFFKGCEVTSGNEFSRDVPGLRCVMLRSACDWKTQEIRYRRTYLVVFRDSDFGQGVKSKCNEGDIEAGTSICDRTIQLEECVYARQLLDLLSCEALNEPGAQYVFTGHGLGGVFALLAARSRSDCCAVTFGAFPIKGGWASLLGDALLRTVNYIEADDPFLRIYGAEGYGNDIALKEWLYVVPQDKRSVGGPQILPRSVSARIRKVIAGESPISCGALMQKVCSSSEEADLTGIAQYLAGGETQTVQEMDAAITAIGVRLLTHYCK